MSENDPFSFSMKLTKPLFTLNPTAFQVYCYLWKKLEQMPPEAQARRIVSCSKGELTSELNHSINTVRQALDVELESSFWLIKKIPNEPDHVENRIHLTEEKDWNWDLIRHLYTAKSAKDRRQTFDSLFDDLSVFDQGSAQDFSKNGDK
ncbi:MAG: hypothetical protein L6Q37_03225 [Bdellovibrionaceae bacterium]|nr:hypothetical protein [Pseudobdellovibrionaceae bacterium]NUM60163.1 hypothetical protein [Pseudobdellovibrionaceae bacterium]